MTSDTHREVADGTPFDFAFDVWWLRVVNMSCCVLLLLLLFVSTFDQSFRASSSATDSRLRFDGFEASVVEVEKDDLHKFFEFLTSNVYGQEE